MRQLTIDRTQWLRGESAVKSQLLRHSDQKMCCLGFLSRDCGATPEQIHGLLTLASLRERNEVTLPEDVQFLLDVKPYSVHDSAVATWLMMVNDAPIGEVIHIGIQGRDSWAGPHKIESEAQREELLTKMFAENGVEVRFIN